jgi:hypothetical protein
MRGQSLQGGRAWVQGEPVAHDVEAGPRLEPPPLLLPALGGLRPAHPVVSAAGAVASAIARAARLFAARCPYSRAHSSPLAILPG